MLLRHTRACLLAVAGSAWLAGCGGIEGTGSPLAGIEGTGVTEGTVSGFGSVYVNGVGFDTDRADIVVDGSAATEEALQVGMVLSVIGEIEPNGLRGQARRIVSDQPLSGPIDALDRQARRGVILGQAVRFDHATLFTGLVEDDLQEGQQCRVSAYPGADGEWLATLLRCSDDYLPGAVPVEVEGLVSELDLAGGSFRIGTLSVQIDNAALDTVQGPLGDGALVEVIGRQPDRGGVLLAEHLRVKSAALEPEQPVSLEGVIGRFNSLGDFELGRQRIDAAAALRDDSHALAPARGVRIRLVGKVREDGAIAAERYALQPNTDILLTGRVDDVDAAADRLTLFGSQRQALQVTQYEDRRETGLRQFRLPDLQSDDYVQLRGFRNDQGKIVVTRVERRDDEEPEGGTIIVSLRIQIGEVDPVAARMLGPLDSHSLTDNRLVIAGVVVQTDAARTEFFDRDGASVTAVQFYNGLQSGDRLEAEGNEASDVIQATRVRYAP